MSFLVVIALGGNLILGSLAVENKRWGWAVMHLGTALFLMFSLVAYATV